MYWGTILGIAFALCGVVMIFKQRQSVGHSTFATSFSRIFRNSVVLKLIASGLLLVLLTGPLSAGKPTPPIAPSNLAATANSTTQITLTWKDNSSDESGFKIERAPASSGAWTQIGTVGPNVTVFASSGLSAATTYYYRVLAYNTRGNSAYSATASATTLAQAAVCNYGLSASSASVAAAGGSGSFNVTAGSGCTWNSSSGAPWSSTAN